MYRLVTVGLDLSGSSKQFPVLKFWWIRYNHFLLLNATNFAKSCVLSCLSKLASFLNYKSFKNYKGVCSNTWWRVVITTSWKLFWATFDLHLREILNRFKNFREIPVGTIIASPFSCYGKLDVNQTYKLETFCQSVVIKWRSLRMRGVLRENLDRGGAIRIPKPKSVVFPALFMNWPNICDPV